MPGLYNTKYRKYFLYLPAKFNQTVKRVHRFKLFYCNSVDIDLDSLYKHSVYFTEILTVFVTVGAHN